LSTIFPKNASHLSGASGLIDAPRHRFRAAFYWRDELANVFRQPRIRASIPITFAQIMIVQRMIKNSAATFLEIYT